MSGKLLVLGAGEHGNVTSDIANLCGYDEIHFFDDNISAHCCEKEVVGDSLDFTNSRKGDKFISIGDNKIRLQIFNQINPREFVNLVHPFTSISHTVKIGSGNLIAPGAIISSYTTIGNAVIVNTSASIDHDCVIEDGAHISPGAVLSGGVTVCRNAWVGSGAVIREGLTIGRGSIIGCGSVVVKDIPAEKIFFGNPAKIYK